MLWERLQADDVFLYAIREEGRGGLGQSPVCHVAGMRAEDGRRIIKNEGEGPSLTAAALRCGSVGK